jgi:hypothetical protein
MTGLSLGLVFQNKMGSKKKKKKELTCSIRAKINGKSYV